METIFLWQPQGHLCLVKKQFHVLGSENCNAEL